MNSSATTPSFAAPSSLSSLVSQLACAFVLGLVMIYAVEFSESPKAHNAAHDVRHANGRVCH